MDEPKSPNRDPAIKITTILLFGIPALCLVGLAIVLVPVFASSKVAADRVDRTARIAEIGRAISIYCGQYDDRLPLAKNWEDEARPLCKDPKAFLKREGPITSIAFNRGLSGINWIDIESPEETPMVFESTLPPPNAAGGLKDIYLPESGPVFIVNAEISTKPRNRTNVSELIWQPKPAKP